ncbi:LacI family DNA-binding transcriptional regulator [Leeuwenhoekiella sp. A16]|uniref:LacI family DNA-binding transcriptional regulator n=1 Tax=unclassified Leeuwenhoekiella TaxID=2615029 RepID=UPI003A811B69|tara:strand:+ start:38825 stop:39844 length:1020 start_codon:yes stop_codon:yes gene_type:complete
MKKKITLKDIAKELDVSVSTVSKSLKDSPEIGDDTREKVKAFAKLYNYKPNNIAISLKNRMTKNIALIIPEIVNDFFASVIHGVEEIANKNGYNVLVCLSNESFRKEVVNIETLATGGAVDGFIISLSKETQLKSDFNHLIEVENQGMPLVMFDRITDQVLCDKVIIDDARGAYNAVSHLIEKGRKKIALITTVDYISVGHLRTHGYFKALLDHGMDFNPDLVVRIEEVESCQEPIRKLLDSQEVDAVFTVNELFAVTVMKEIKSIGKQIPKDIAIVGFSDGRLLQHATPGISTVSQHGDEMGRVAARMLIKRLQSEKEEESFSTRVIKTTLIERESSI